MAKKGAREIVGMVCTVCKCQNFTTDRNKVNMANALGGKATKLELKKYCAKCRKYQLHKETSKLK